MLNVRQRCRVVGLICDLLRRTLSDPDDAAIGRFPNTFVSRPTLGPRGWHRRLRGSS
jgi:hypothetical protein